MKRSNSASSAIYSANSELRSPKALFQSMTRDLHASRGLAMRLTIRDISANYRQNLMGFLWVVVPVILPALLFIALQSKHVVNIAVPDMPYPLFVLIGSALWQTFTDSINMPLKVVLSAKQILSKVNFPREALLLSAILQTLFAFLFRVALIGAVLVYFDMSIGLNTALALFPILLLIWLGTILGTLITPMGALIGDVSQSLQIVLQLAFFVTPVVYPPPTSYPYSLISAMNPAGTLIVWARELLVNNGSHGLAVWSVAFGVLGLTVATCIAWLVYRISMPIIIERMSA